MDTPRNLRRRARLIRAAHEHGDQWKSKWEERKREIIREALELIRYYERCIARVTEECDSAVDRIRLDQMAMEDLQGKSLEEARGMERTAEMLERAMQLKRRLRR